MTAHEGHRDSRLDRLDRPERPRRRRRASRSPARRRARRRRATPRASPSRCALPERSRWHRAAARVARWRDRPHRALDGADGVDAVATHPDADIVLFASSGTAGARRRARRDRRRQDHRARQQGNPRDGRRRSSWSAARAPRRRRPAGRQRAQRDPPVPPRPIGAGRRAPDPHRVGRPVPRTLDRRPRSRHAGRGAAAPDVADGAEDHDRLGDADEQGARGDRGALALRRRPRAHRRARAPAVDRALDGRVRRRLDHRAARRHRHAAADPVRVLVPGALDDAAGAARSRAAGRLDFEVPDTSLFPVPRARVPRAARATPGCRSCSTPPTRSPSRRFSTTRIGFTAIPDLIRRAMDAYEAQRPALRSRAWTTSGASIAGRRDHAAELAGGVQSSVEGAS